MSKKKDNPSINSKEDITLDDVNHLVFALSHDTIINLYKDYLEIVSSDKENKVYYKEISSVNLSNYEDVIDFEILKKNSKIPILIECDERDLDNLETLYLFLNNTTKFNLDFEENQIISKYKNIDLESIHLSPTINTPDLTATSTLPVVPPSVVNVNFNGPSPIEGQSSPANNIAYTSNVEMPWQFSAVGIVVGFFLGFIPLVIAFIGRNEIYKGRSGDDYKIVYNVICGLFVVGVILYLIIMAFFAATVHHYV